MEWLLEQSALSELRNAHLNGKAASAEDQMAFEAAETTAQGDSPRILQMAGNIASIRVEGVLTQKPNWMARFFGGGNTAYSEIISALRYANQDSSISKIELKVDTPGGQVDGLFELLDVMKSVGKPIHAIVSNRAGSAGYAIVSAADKIIAKNHASSFGSIGVAISLYSDEKQINLASTEAPKKRPDITTEEGKAVIVEQLDALHEIFVDAIASGRNTNTTRVNAEFGNGAMLLAEEALKRGMIDSIASNNKKSTVATVEGSSKTNTKMDKTKLKTEHPDVFAAVLQQGIDQERDRVSAHVIMGEASGDIQTALTAVREGTEMTNTLRATYEAASMKRRDQEDRQEESVDSNAADDGGQDDQVSNLTAVEDGILASLGLPTEGAK